MKPTFKQFLCEQEQSVSKEQIINFVKTNCQPFLREVNKLHPLYRGIPLSEEEKTNPYFVLSPKSDRIPKDTPRDIHRVVDQWFLEHFGHRYRSHAVFGVSSLPNASEYGTPYYLLPIGEFSYCWSQEYADMFASLEDKMHEFIDVEDEYTKQNLIQFLEAGKYIDTNLKDACRVGHEVMIKCDKYILINPHYGDYYLEWSNFFK